MSPTPPSDPTKPETTPRGGGPQESDAEFGALLAQRSPSFIHWLVVLFVLALFVGSLALSGVGAYQWFNAPPARPLHPGITPPPPSDEWVVVAAGIVLAGIFGVVGYYLVREAMTRTKFYELGVRHVGFGKVRRSMAYGDCERFWYTIVRQYVNGLYVGTALTITMKAKGKPTIKWSGSHKEKPKGFSITVFGKGEFKGEDELDVVKLVIADAMADRWIHEMSDGLSKSWCKQLALGIESANILSGKRKGQQVTYDQLDRLSFGKGTFHLFHKEDKKSSVNIAMGAENFWPGFRVLQRMWMIAAPDREMGTEEGEAEQEP